MTAIGTTSSNPYQQLETLKKEFLAYSIAAIILAVISVLGGLTMVTSPALVTISAVAACVSLGVGGGLMFALLVAVPPLIKVAEIAAKKDALEKLIFVGAKNKAYTPRPWEIVPLLKERFRAL